MSLNEAEKPLLVLDNISTNEENGTHLSKVNLTIQKGSIHALVGDSGSGKSAVAGIISGEISDYTGKYFFNDRLIINNSSNKAMKFNVLSLIHRDGIHKNLNAY